MSNTTNVTGLSSSISYHHAQGNASAHGLSTDTANDLGYGVGKIIRGAFDNLWKTWQKVWILEPTAEEIANLRNYMIYKSGLTECVERLGPALANLRMNPNDLGALNKVEQLSDHYVRYLEPSHEENLRELQSRILKPLEERVSALARLHMKNLSKWMPVFFQGNNLRSGKALNLPTCSPTSAPTRNPTPAPTRTPTSVPTCIPITTPTFVPTNAPTTIPTLTPTNEPTDFPTDEPTTIPTQTPTNEPTGLPTDTPTSTPTLTPTNSPTGLPTDVPTNIPTLIPTDSPTNIPPSFPTSAPTEGIKSTGLFAVLGCVVGAIIVVVGIGIYRLKKKEQEEEKPINSGKKLVINTKD
jgi:hypothetical protein